MKKPVIILLITARWRTRNENKINDGNQAENEKNIENGE